MRQSTSITGCVRRSFGWLVGRLVGRSVTHSFDDPHVAPIGQLGLVLDLENSGQAGGFRVRVSIVISLCLALG